MRSIKKKVFAYITCQRELLVFSHPYAPEAGIQVPAGTLEDGERPTEGVLREAFEETGLTDLSLDRFLGEQIRDMRDFGRDEIHHRYFYHLCYHGEPVSSWRHEERYNSNGLSLVPVIFEFFWASLPDGVPPLIADHGYMLPRLVTILALKNG